MEGTKENYRIAKEIQKCLKGKTVREAAEIISYVQQRISATSLVTEDTTFE